MANSSKAIIHKPIPGYVGLYEATNDGRIFNVISKKELKQTKRQAGRNENIFFPSVTLVKDGQYGYFHVSTIIGRTFINDSVKIGFTHKDGNRFNNVVDNLKEKHYKRNVKLLFYNNEKEFDSLQAASKYLGYNKNYLSYYLFKFNNLKVVIDGIEICQIEFLDE